MNRWKFLLVDKEKMMKKTLLLLIMSLISLAVMACGMIGFTQIENGSQPPKNTGNAIGETPEEPKLADEINSGPQVLQPTPAPTLDPVVAAKSCLAKTWEIAGLSDYVIAAVPSKMAADYDLQYE
jgi:hypothetical protein